MTKESPLEYVGRTMMNVLLVFRRDSNFQKTLQELGIFFDLQDLLLPIVDESGLAGAQMMYWYRQLSPKFNLDKVNEQGFKGSWNSLEWRSQDDLQGPLCGNCKNETTAILYGMPGDDFNFQRFEVGGCLVDDSNPVWVCRKCEWAI